MNTTEKNINSYCQKHFWNWKFEQQPSPIDTHTHAHNRNGRQLSVHDEGENNT